MNTRPKRWCWRKDLSEFRGLTDRERAGFLLLLEWFENWRLRYELPAGREAAARFWKEEVKREERQWDMRARRYRFLPPLRIDGCRLLIFEF